MPSALSPSSPGESNNRTWSRAMPDRVPPISRFLYPASLSNTVYKCKVVKYRSSSGVEGRLRWSRAARSRGSLAPPRGPVAGGPPAAGLAHLILNTEVQRLLLARSGL